MRSTLSTISARLPHRSAAGLRVTSSNRRTIPVPVPVPVVLAGPPSGSSRHHSTRTSSYDVVIMGGGCMGSSVAYHLALKNLNSNGTSDLKIAVVERDCTYRIASAMLSAGGIRQQFSASENVSMSIYSAQFLKNMKALEVDGEVPDIQFHEHGYLYLSGDKTKHILEANNKVQRSCGADWINLHDEKCLSQLFPWLNTDGIALGSYSSKNEGYFDPWSFVRALKKKAVSFGVEYIDGTVSDASIVPVTKTSSSSFQIESITVLPAKVERKQQTQAAVKIAASTFVNCTGAWAGQLMDTIAQKTGNPNTIARLPVVRRKRCIFLVHCPGRHERKQYPVPPHTTPLVIDPTGVYFRPEGQGGRFIVGVSPDETRDVDCQDDKDLEVIDHDLFTDIIWPTLCERVPAFEQLKVNSSWAGFYDYNTVDQNGIIGSHSEIRNLVLCNGFSGHGLQQSPAAGLAVAELVHAEKFSNIDLSRFSFTRIVDQTPVFETGIV